MRLIEMHRAEALARDTKIGSVMDVFGWHLRHKSFGPLNEEWTKQKPTINKWKHRGGAMNDRCGIFSRITTINKTVIIVRSLISLHRQRLKWKSGAQWQNKCIGWYSMDEKASGAMTTSMAAAAAFSSPSLHHYCFVQFSFTIIINGTGRNGISFDCHVLPVWWGTVSFGDRASLYRSILFSISYHNK